MSVHIDCNGCGESVPVRPGDYPYGWRRLNVSGRSDTELPGLELLDVVDVCSPICAARAMELHIDPSAGELRLVGP